MNACLHAESAHGRGRVARCWRLAAVVCAVLALNLAGDRIAAQLDIQVWPRHSDMIDVIIVALLLAYVLLMAMPFVPGIEIGLALMLMLGEGGIVLVYLCTQLALALGFLAGRLVPTRCLAAAFGCLQLERARGLAERLESIPAAQRLEYLSAQAPRRWLSVLLRRRYLALALLLNLPGNALIGGAGAIAMIAAMSGAYSFPRFLLLAGVATTPVPLFLLAGGGA